MFIPCLGAYLTPDLLGGGKTVMIGNLILFEASLSFLGVGVPLTTPTWGRMVFDGIEYVATAWSVAPVTGVLSKISTPRCCKLRCANSGNLPPRSAINLGPASTSITRMSSSRIVG